MIKATVITDNQKDKLIEIIKHVYGKYRVYYDEIDRKVKEEEYKLCEDSLEIIENGILIIIFKNPDRQSFPYKSYRIHWLDFCLNVLPKEIFRKEINKYGSGHLQHHVTKMTSGEWNPVDYLYNQLGLDK